MFKKKTDAKTPQHAESQLTNLSWETDIVLLERKSRKTAWLVAGVSAVLVAILGTSIAFLLPLKKVVPYVVMVDKITGENSVIETGREFTTQSALTEKHWIQAFLLARERYMYRFLQFDYDTVRLLAGDRVWANYKTTFEGNDSLDKKLKDEVEIIPSVLSIALQGNGTATVRYEVKTKDYRITNPPAVVRRIATLRYEFQSKNFAVERDAIANPLGFTITGYQTDPEMGSAP